LPNCLIFSFLIMRTELKEAEHYIKSLIEAGEGQLLDFKFEISNAKKMARTFSAFANTDGGRLLIGVKDNGKISGIRSEEEAYMAESAAHVFCKPAVIYRLKKWEIDGKCILEVEIPTSKFRPHFAKGEEGDWIAYVRIGDQNIQANRVLVNVWKNEGKKKGGWLNYGREEKSLMDFLAENERITLTGFIKVARTSHSQAERILVNLILMNVITVELTDKAVFYRLNSKHS
jgi:predicted HTH transcriptional regulator